MKTTKDRLQQALNESTEEKRIKKKTEQTDPQRRDRSGHAEQRVSRNRSCCLKTTLTERTLVRVFVAHVNLL